MNKFTRDIGATLINMLWYLSNYPDFDDYGQTTRRDFIESAIEKIEPHLSEHKEDIEQIFKEFKDGFKDHPYSERATLFADDLLGIIKNREDVIFLFLNGDDLRKKASAKKR
jgi:hypothetical protein